MGWTACRLLPRFQPCFLLWSPWITRTCIRCQAPAGPVAERRSEFPEVLAAESYRVHRAAAWSPEERRETQSEPRDPATQLGGDDRQALGVALNVKVCTTILPCLTKNVSVPTS
jgi:hypothetical protein